MTQRNTEERKAELKARRERQRSRQPDRDARLVYFSKNSLPEYKKD
jgi:hypothetical protein